jgi:hypothetical protein
MIMAIYRTKFLVDIYRLSYRGFTQKYIAKQIGVSPAGFSLWIKNKASVRYAIRKGRRDRKNTNEGTFSEYIRGRLSPKMQSYWDFICAHEKSRSGYAKIKLLLENKGEKIKQKLLVYSLIYTGFDLSKALKRVAVSRRTFNRWKETDFRFTGLLHEVEEIQKDFYENALVNLVKSGDSPAIRFVNRTKNKDRGYTESTEVNVTHGGSIGVMPLPLGDLKLSPACKRELLAAVRDYNQRKKLNSAAIPNNLLASGNDTSIIEAKRV